MTIVTQHHHDNTLGKQLTIEAVGSGLQLKMELQLNMEAPLLHLWFFVKAPRCNGSVTTLQEHPSFLSKDSSNSFDVTGN